jgi:hypothetical protein
MRRNQYRERGPGNDKVHLGQKVLSPCLLAVTVEAEAGGTYLSHAGHAQGLKGRSVTESENQ